MGRQNRKYFTKFLNTMLEELVEDGKMEWVEEARAD